MAKTFTRKTKVGGKSKGARKAKPARAKGQKKAAAKKKASKKASASPTAKKAAPPAARRAVPDAALALDVVPRPAPAPLAAGPHDPAKLVAVGECLDSFMDTQHPGWSNDDKVTKFRYSAVSIVGVLTIVQNCLQPKYQFTISQNLPKKCTSAAETILQMKIDIDGATV